MNRLLLGLLMFVAAATATMAQKVVETTPARPQENGGVTITYRPALDARNGEFPMKDVTEVWAYTGARAVPIAQGDGKYYEKAPWNDLKNFAELKLKNNGDGTHTLVIENIKAFYGVDAADPVRELLFVFRNVDGTVQGSDQLVAIDPAGGATTAKLRLINGVATSENADLIVDRATEAQITNIGFQLASGYRDVPSGAAVNIKAKKSGAPAPIYADVDKAMVKDAKYTLVIGENGDEFVTRWLPDTAVTSAGNVTLRFVHMSPATPKIDILALMPGGGGAPVLQEVSFLDAVGYADFPAGTYKLAVAASGSTEPLVTFNPVDLPANTALTIVAFGNADGLTKVRAFIDNDNGRDFVDVLPLGEGWIVKADPATPSFTTEGVTVTYNPENDKKDGQFKMVGVEDVFVYTGARDYTGGYYEKAGWGDVGATDAVKLTKNVDGTFNWTIPSPINAFYPNATGKTLKELLMVFRNADGTKQGCDITLYVGDGTGKTVTTEPADASSTKPLAVTYYPWNDKKDGQFRMVSVSDVFIYTGGICEDGTYLEKAGWANVGGTDGLKLTKNADGTHTLNIADLNAFYSVPTDKKLKEILLVFRNAEGTKQGSDVKIPVDQPTSVEDDALAAAVKVYPNPTSNDVHITLPTDVATSVTIVNAVGQPVSQFTATGVAVWNGKDASGRAVAPGSYFMNLRAGNATTVVPVVIIR